MPTSYSPLLGLALPVTGELAGTWGSTVNDYITAYLDSAVAGAQTISGSQTAVTLTTTNGSTLTQAGSGSTGSAQYQIINCTGNPASLLTITVPAQSKAYLVLNATSTSQSVKVVGAGPTTGVTMVSGERALIAWDGSDFVKVATSTADGVTTLSFGTTGLTPNSATAGAITVAGTLVAANGGTGQSSYTTGDLLYATGSTALSKLGIGTNGQVLTSTGTAPQWSTLSGVAVTTFSAGTTGFTPSTATSGAVTLAGTLATTNGGTGLTSFTANGVVYASSTSALATGSALTFDGTNLSVGGSNSQQRLNVVVPVFTTNASGGMRIGDSGNNYYVDQLVTTDGSANPFWDVKFATHTLSRYAYGGGNNFWAWYANNSEQMRLTSTGLGIGTSSPADRLHVLAGTTYVAAFNTTVTTAATTRISIGGFTSSGSGAGGSVAIGSVHNHGSTALSSMTFYTHDGTNQVERARIDSSGNLGIGTSSPTSQLTVGSGATANPASTVTFQKATASEYRLKLTSNSFNSNGEWLGLGFGYSDNYMKAAVIAEAKDGNGRANLHFALQADANSTNASLSDSKMVLTYSGNLGLGVTPSAWGSAGAKGLQVGTALALGYTNATGSFIAGNAYYSSTGWQRVTTGAATAYLLGGDGAHIWYSTSTSSTANSAISFTQAMTLDANGSLAVGGTTVVTNNGGITATTTVSGSVAATLAMRNAGTGNGSGTTLVFRGVSNASAEHDYAYVAGVADDTTAKTGSIRFSTTAGSSPVERARITSGGDILKQYGTAFQSYTSGGSISHMLSYATWNGTANLLVLGNTFDGIVFGTGGGTMTEKARITSGGDLLVGTTSTGGKLTVEQTGSNANGAIITNQTYNYQTLGLHNTATANDNLWVTFGTEASFTTRGSIDYNRAGGLTRYNTTSDYRAKDILGPVQNPGTTIDALKVYEGQMKGATQPRPMLVAHEAQEHAPYAVSGVKDEVNEDGTPKFQQMDVSSLVPLLIAEIQSLRARVAQLEAK